MQKMLSSSNSLCCKDINTLSFICVVSISPVFVLFMKIFLLLGSQVVGYYFLYCSDNAENSEQWSSTLITLGNHLESLENYWCLSFPLFSTHRYPDLISVVSYKGIKVFKSSLGDSTVTSELSTTASERPSQ